MADWTHSVSPLGAATTQNGFTISDYQNEAGVQPGAATGRGLWWGTGLSVSEPEVVRIADCSVISQDDEKKTIRLRALCNILRNSIGSIFMQEVFVQCGE